jgi:hypothetical protein
MSEKNAVNVKFAQVLHLPATNILNQENWDTF